MGQIRTRFNIVNTGVGRTWAGLGYAGAPDPGTSTGTYPYSIVEDQLVDSSDHGWNPKGPNYGDVGGSFYSLKHRHSGNTPRVKIWDPVSGYRYDGLIAANTLNVTASTYPLPAASSVLSMYAKGATAISRTAPNNPVFSAPQALGELVRDGIPDLPFLGDLKERASVIRKKEINSGNEYLNLEFGWAPLVSDVRKLCYAVKNSHKILNQFKRDSGRLVRRSYTFPTEVETETHSNSNGCVPALYAGFYVYGDGPMVYTKVTQRDAWFKGAYTYYLDPGEDALGKVARHASEASKLLGLRLTPDTLWNLAPWSWAADWFGNVGDIATNYSNFMQDSLVLKYGYIMEHSTVTESYQKSPQLFKKESNPVEVLSYDLVQSFTTEVKQRYPCGPYGFGVSIESLSATQTAIITALGLSRSGRRAL